MLTLACCVCDMLDLLWMDSGGAQYQFDNINARMIAGIWWFRFIVFGLGTLVFLQAMTVVMLVSRIRRSAGE